jgi:hypothetical protein
VTLSVTRSFVPSVEEIVMEDLSALLNSARSLNAHIGRPDRPVINRNLEQIESDTRNLISRLPGTDQEGRAYVNTFPQLQKR